MLCKNRLKGKTISRKGAKAQISRRDWRRISWRAFAPQRLCERVFIFSPRTSDQALLTLPHRKRHGGHQSDQRNYLFFTIENREVTDRRFAIWRSILRFVSLFAPLNRPLFLTVWLGNNLDPNRVSACPHRARSISCALSGAAV